LSLYAFCCAVEFDLHSGRFQFDPFCALRDSEFDLGFVRETRYGVWFWASREEWAE